MSDITLAAHDAPNVTVEPVKENALTLRAAVLLGRLRQPDDITH
jgi:hypothetical protein